MSGREWTARRRPHAVMHRTIDHRRDGSVGPTECLAAEPGRGSQALGQPRLKDRCLADGLSLLLWASAAEARLYQKISPNPQFTAS